MLNPVWNDGTGFLKISTKGANLPNSLQVRNSKGKEITVYATYDESIDVALGHSIMYLNLQTKETVFVSFQ